LAMVARLTVDRKKYAAVREEMLGLLAEVEAQRPALQSAAREDAAAFEAVMAACTLPKGNAAEARAAADAMRAATIRAAEIPLGVAQSAARLLELAQAAAERANAATITDAGSSGEMAGAALRAALLNVRINALSMGDDPQAQVYLHEADDLLARGEDALASVRQAVRDRMRAG
jgi:formiminotetrahydrofolate cyclodeaminase